MSTSTSTLIADGVTTAYLRELTRRPAPSTDTERRRAASRSRRIPAVRQRSHRLGGGRATPASDHGYVR
jgi:hypothetical protein